MSSPFRLDLFLLRRLIDAWQPRRAIEACRLTPQTSDATRVHLTIASDGSMRTGCHWDAETRTRTPPSTQNDFVIAVGDGPDQGDGVTGPWLQTAAWAVAFLQDRFDLPIDAWRLDGDPGFISVPAFENELRMRRGEPLPTSRRSKTKAAAKAFVEAEKWLQEEPPIMSDDIDQIDGPARRRGPAHSRNETRSIGVDPDTLARLRPHLIDLWEGRLSQEGLFRNDAADVDRIFGEDLPRYLADTKAKVLRIVLYAHGGLVDEESGLNIAANQIPWWTANGCYPLQFIWQTGLFETIEKIIGVKRGFTDFSDAVVEGAARAIGGPAIWGNMKHSASRAFEPGADGTGVIERLVAFAKANAPRVQLHAVGHSAGAIFHAYLMQQLTSLGGPALESLTLLAPAATVDLYERLIDPLIPGQVKRVRIFTMKEALERADTVTPAYRKSLLYLIYHALETKPEEPILGLEECLRADPLLKKRFGLDGTPSDTGSIVWSQTASTTGSSASRSTSHGDFDNDVPTMNSVARDILGIADDVALPVSFPPDTQTRGLRAIPERPSFVARPSTPSRRTAPDGATRKALCIGINAYPAPNALHGCVADADAWGDALTLAGFAVDKLQDAAATRANILGRLEALVGQSQPGDVLVVQYAGHGTQVPDLDGDEPTINGKPGKDQAVCPVDFEDGHLLIDDDIRAVFDRLPAGVHLTCFMDNCSSGTDTRLLAGRAPSGAPGSLVRFVEITPPVLARYIALRQNINRARSLVGGRRGAGTREEMRWISFAACRNDESAYETAGRGDFSTIAVPLLAQRGAVTNAQFQDLVQRQFGAQPRQHPVLDCRDPDTGETFLIGASDGSAASGRVAAVVAQGGPGAPGGGQRPPGSHAGDVADLLEAISRLLR